MERPLFEKKEAESRASLGAAEQIMMANSRVCVRVPAKRAGVCGTALTEQPCVLRAMTLQRQRGSDIIEGLVRHDVVPFEKPREM